MMSTSRVKPEALKRQSEMRQAYLQGETSTEIGKRYGLSSQRVGQILRPVIQDNDEREHRQAMKNRRQQTAIGPIAQSPEDFRQRVIGLMEQNIPTVAIASQLEVKIDVVHDVLNSLDPAFRAAWRRRTFAAIAEKRPPAFTAEELLTYLAQAARISGLDLSKTSYIKLTKQHPDWPKVGQFVGQSWESWLTAAGIARKSVQGDNTSSRYEPDDYARAMRRVGAYYGRHFTTTEYRAVRRHIEPTVDTILRQCQGKWRQALHRYVPDLPE